MSTATIQVNCCLIFFRGGLVRKGGGYSLLLARGYSVDFTQYPLVMMHISIKQGAATHSAHNYRPGTHLYSWVERGTICVITLPKGANLYTGWYRTHDHCVMSRAPSPLCYRGRLYKVQRGCWPMVLILQLAFLK